MRPANEGDLLKKPHVYVKRADGSSGYEPIPDVEPAPKSPSPIAVVPKIAAK